MAVPVPLPEDLVDEVDRRAPDRVAFVVEAVRRHLGGPSAARDQAELERLNEFADELNREAAEVLEFQAIR